MTDLVVRTQFLDCRRGRSSSPFLENFPCGTFLILHQATNIYADENIPIDIQNFVKLIIIQAKIFLINYFFKKQFVGIDLISLQDKTKKKSHHEAGIVIE